MNIEENLPSHEPLGGGVYVRGGGGYLIYLVLYYDEWNMVPKGTFSVYLFYVTYILSTLIISLYRVSNLWSL